LFGDPIPNLIFFLQSNTGWNWHGKGVGTGGKRRDVDWKERER